MSTHRLSAALFFALAVLACAVISGCSSSSNPLAAFQPEIANNTDSFEFQVTAATNVSTTVDYIWLNTGSRATINQSSAVTSGSVSLTLFGPDGLERYSGSLATNGTFQSDTAAAGSWRIRVSMTNLSGTLNFRAQKL
jgi:PBP1b-binding outer membrane lipoprotein LpoB